ncbi:glycosyltransferase [Bacillus timonensis]|uniref:glycosyltransferase n=1 Tax=Bacillus timonensis TaxID=1033734 RepID=UPI000288FC7D|nr:glycosyltransferase [Bacillus timonensis]
MPNISLVMIVKNEEENLRNCLVNSKPYINELVIIDTGSTDETKEIAREFGAQVYDFEWNNDFSEVRNFALSKSNSDWNLILDADEQVIKWDQDKVNNILESKNLIGRINIKNQFVQNNEVRYSQTYISRLLPKGTYYTGKIHEQVVSDLPRIDLPIEVLHMGYYKTDKSERNLSILKSQYSDNPKNVYINYQLARQYKVLNQFPEALLYYQQSYHLADKSEDYYIDLVVNYIYTLIDMKEYYLAFEVIDRENNFLLNSPDYQFVTGLFYMNFVLSDIKRNIDFLPLIEKSYLQCLALGEKGAKEIVLGTSTFLAAYNLGVYYEMFNQKEKAKHLYKLSSSFHYEPAKKRLMNL